MPQGADTIIELGPYPEDWRGDPIPGGQRQEREIRFCQLIPRTHPDDDTLIIEGWQVYVPPGQIPPDAESRIKARKGRIGTELIEWEIDGNVAPYDKAGTDKGAFFILVRVR